MEWHCDQLFEPGRMSQTRITDGGRKRIMRIVSTLASSWLGMEAVHELGQIIDAWSSAGSPKLCSVRFRSRAPT
jgi:hypothetical protein